MATGTRLNAAAPAPLRLLLDGIDKLSRLDGWLGAGCLIALTLLMLAEVIVRALSNVFTWVPADIPVAWEYSSYLMAACFTFGAAMTLRAGGHIRVSLVLARLSPGARRVLEGTAALIATIFIGFMAYAMVRFTWGSYTRGQTSISSDTALWIPQAVIAFGFVLLALQFLARTIQAALGLKLEDESMKVASVAE
ncbi:TRAP transporter small permease subunit [Reyranella sp. CPCC 100927]|uniref:TRAP transporter small permease subunit n=1 Tax=Reyranella sp. CPCC 100927 TaxID=2599616 RepID=UPI0011B6AC34|nr:TRAP transporter small permease [Reyranella sp. CPCC 100927]TWT13910.1 TRAP transporter small permease [Reyranella sp. CPCC 100927]